MTTWNPTILDASTAVVLYEDGSIACLPTQPASQEQALSPRALLGVGEGAVLAFLPKGQVFVPDSDHDGLALLSTGHGEPHRLEEYVARLRLWADQTGPKS